jgi:TetR/AcrR family transcriptional regulator, mexCD-oprJ operon repressor
MPPRAQRADAHRNVAAILDAATDCLARDPEVSIAGIAAAANIVRMATIGKDGPTGTFQEDDGELGW